MAGFRPGFGRGGMIHSLRVMMVGVAIPEAGEMAALLEVFIVLMASTGGAGAREGGDPAELQGVGGEAMVASVVQPAARTARLLT